MEQVLPGENPGAPDTDPILEAVERKETGDSLGAYRKLMTLLAEDLRCLDARAHLGNFLFDHSPEKAIRHYEVGGRIGELSLGEGFNGVFPWGHINNRPFLRCMHGYGLCLWRLGRLKEAEEIFTRMLWLNPPDNQGVRFVLGEVREGKTWHEQSGSNLGHEKSRGSTGCVRKDIGLSSFTCTRAKPPGNCMRNYRKLFHLSTLRQ